MWTIVATSLALLCLDICFADWASEGNPYSFSCNGTKNQTKAVVWTLKTNNGREVRFFQCKTTSNGTCDAAYEGTPYEANITLNEVSVTSILLIKNITLDQHKSQWKCIIDTGSNDLKFNTTYDVSVFAVPEKQTCNNAVLADEPNILFQCFAYKISPEALCNFFVKSNNKDPVQVRNQSVNYNSVQSSDKNYTNTECNLTISGTALGLGTHQIYLVVYPNITGNVTVDMKRTSNYTDPITINQPKAALAQDCNYDMYIKENEPRNCTCYDTTSSFMPAHVRWDDVFSNSVNATLNFTAQRKSSSFNGTFKCTITSLDWMDQKIYQPPVAYPPHIFNVTLTEFVFDTCDADNVNVTGACLVGESYPIPKLYVTLNSLKVDIPVVNIGVNRFEKTLNATGFFNVSCHFDNTAYLRSVSTGALIKGPPEIPQIFTVLNGVMITPSENVLQVTKEESIVCQSSGGYPNIQNLYLACGNETQINNTNIVTLNLNRTSLPAPSKITCTCIVQHESRCLRNTTKVEVMINGPQPIIIDKEFVAIYMGVGVAFGLFLLSLFVVLCFSRIRLCQLKNSASGVFEKLVSNSEIYLIKNEKSEKTPTEYTNVVTTMTSAMEFPKNFKSPI